MKNPRYNKTCLELVILRITSPPLGDYPADQYKSPSYVPSSDQLNTEFDFLEQLILYQITRPLKPHSRS